MTFQIFIIERNKNRTGTFRGTVGSQTINCIKNSKISLEKLRVCITFKNNKIKVNEVEFDDDNSLFF